MTDDRYIDIHLEFSLYQLMREKDHVRTIAEASHHTATEAAHREGVRLSHPEPVDINTTRATTPNGADVILVATRWQINR
jgi:hypothetical protein